MKDQRRHIRLPLSINAEFRLIVGESYRGRTRNIGLGGMYVEFQDMPVLQVGDRCTLTLILYERKRRLAKQFKCQVIHKSWQGAGFKIHNIDYAYTGYFRDVLAQAAPPSGRLIEDLHCRPGILRADTFLPPRSHLSHQFSPPA